MLTIIDIDRAVGRLGGAAFVPRTRRVDYSPLGYGGALELGPEIVLPEQLDDLGKRCRVPEHRLMLAVLEDAVAVYQTGCATEHLSGRPLFRETEAWFASEDTSSPFSVVTICQLFAIDPDYLRAGLRRWQARYAERPRIGRPVSFAFRRVSGIRHRVTCPPLRRGA